MTFYNDIDQFALRWTEELMNIGLVTKGKTDGRSIADIHPDDLRIYDRCHFFSGIAGWDYALRLAGWPEEREVWTGSCPCQSFSTAGKGKGFDDPRGQLWTQFFRLIKARRPKYVFGEQVGAAIRYGWLDRVLTDLEGEGYSTGAAVLGAHSAGAPHVRQRIYWGAWLSNSEHNGSSRSDGSKSTTQPSIEGQQDGERQLAGGSCIQVYSRIPNPGLLRQEIQQQPAAGIEQCGKGGLVQPDSAGSQQGRQSAEAAGHGDTVDSTGCGIDGMAYDYRSGRGKFGGTISVQPEFPPAERHGPWRSWRPTLCRDNKYRRIPAQSHVQLGTDGVPDGMGTRREGGGVEIPLCPLTPKGSWRGGNRVLKGAGNAIVPQAAAMFVRAVMEETMGVWVTTLIDASGSRAALSSHPSNLLMRDET